MHSPKSLKCNGLPVDFKDFGLYSLRARQSEKVGARSATTFQSLSLFSERGLTAVPLFSIDIEKSYVGEFWTNRYIVDTTDLDAAAANAGAFVGYERAIHSDAITFTRARVADRTQGTDIYRIITYNSPGLRVTEGPFIPLWNVALVDFHVDIGRPSRKYLRVGFTEADVVGSAIENSLLVLIGSQYISPLAAGSAFVDVDGQPITSGTARSTVMMRQLRRGSKRRTTPVL